MGLKLKSGDSAVSPDDMTWTPQKFFSGRMDRKNNLMDAKADRWCQKKKQLADGRKLVPVVRIQRKEKC